MPVRQTHPFFGVQVIPALVARYYQLRVTYPPQMPVPDDLQPLRPEDLVPLHGREGVQLEGVQGNRLSISVKLYPSSENDGVFGSVIEAEDEIFRKIEETGLTRESRVLNLDFQGLIYNDEIAALPVHINRQANLIASRTRRGAGNVTIMSQFMADKLADSRMATFSRARAPEQPIRYLGSNLVYVGILNNSIKVFVHKEWEDDHSIVTTYKGGEEIDAGAYLLPCEIDQSFTLCLPKNTIENLGNWMDYFQAMKVTFE